MNLQEIKAAIDSGKRVFWVNESYEVIKDSNGEYLIHRSANNYTTGLTGKAGTEFENVLNGAEADFYITETQRIDQLTKQSETDRQNEYTALYMQLANNYGILNVLEIIASRTDNKRLANDLQTVINRAL